jgi:signal transduction histidine kinase
MLLRPRLNTRLLRVLAVILPVVFWAVQLRARTLLFNEQRTLEGDLFALVLIALASIIFSAWVFGIVDHREREIQRRSVQLAALHDAGIALTTELNLSTVLQKVVDLARTLVGARYGALGVLDEEGKHIEQFVTSGISPEVRAALGEPPRGHGLLGVLIKDATPIRLPEISRDPRAVGFPPNHPPMHSLLGVPIVSKGRVFGDLYLTDKIPVGQSEGAAYTWFAPQDQEVLEMFATQAAIAIENAQLYRRTQQLAVLQERERFGMDLHDGIIQSIYAIGLMLEDIEQQVKEEPQDAAPRLQQAIHGLNDVIRDIRNYILDLRPERFQGRDLSRGLEELARDLRANTLLNVNVNADSVDTTMLTPEQVVEMLHIVQEALTNIRKHARASGVDIALAREGGDIIIAIADDGIGIRANSRGGGGNGLPNMRERARQLSGSIEVAPRKRGGTRVTLRVPLHNRTGEFSPN